MRGIPIFAILTVSLVAVENTQNLAGDWQGTLQAGPQRLRLVLHITESGDGGLSASLASIDQGAKAIPVSSIRLKGSKLSLSLDAIHGSYQGKVNADGTVISGEWEQMGNWLPLIFKRADVAAGRERRRPQNPVKPYPYREEEVTYENHAAGIQLAASLTIPLGRGPFPAVVLISGSGPLDRDESVMGHHTFLVLADNLTRKGIVVLRADKRGVGKSPGNYAAATMTDFSSDVEAGVAYLRTRAEVDAHHIGLVGHSEGGIVAPMVAIRNPAVAFIVLMAGPGVPGDQILATQNALALKGAGKNTEEIERALAADGDVFTLLKSENATGDGLEKKLREKLAGLVPASQMDAQMKILMSPWFREFIEYDPASALSKVQVPVLAINGDKDTQVMARQNLPAIRKALSGNKNCEIDELAGLNHLFQTAKTGSPSEYVDIEETISPVVLEKIAGWILGESAKNPS